MLFNRNRSQKTNRIDKIFKKIKKSKTLLFLSVLIAAATVVSGCNLDAVTSLPGEFSHDSASASVPMSSEPNSQSATSSQSLSSSSESGSDSASSSAYASSSIATPTTGIENKYMYVGVSKANFRSEPSTARHDTIIGQLYYRARVTRLSLDGDWSKIATADDEIGYIYSEFLSETLPTVTPTPTPARTLEKWPSVSSLTETFYSANLNDYIGRALEYEPLKGITVILDPGHGGADPGASYNSTVLEKTINLDVASKIGKRLKDMGATVVMTRTADNTLGLYYRNAFINQYILEKHKDILLEKGEDTAEVDRLIGLMQDVMDRNTDVISAGGRGIFLGLGVSEDIRTIMDITSEYDDVILLSIHCNNIDNSPSSSGVEIYFGTNGAIYEDEKRLLASESPSNPINPEYQFYNDSARSELATALRDGIRKETTLDMRGPWDGLYAWNFCMLRENNLASALIELGYLSNLSDRSFLTDPFNQELMALGIANSVYNYYCAE